MAEPIKQDHPNFYRVDMRKMRIRSLVDAYTVWQGRCTSDEVAIWGELDFLDFDVAVIPFMMVVDIDGGPGYGRYRFWGSSVASADGKDMTNLRISDLSPPRHAYYSEQQYRWVVENACPSVFVACLGEKSWNRKYEAVLRLPCRSDPDSGIDRVVAVGFYSDRPEAISDFLDEDVDLRNYFDPDA